MVCLFLCGSGAGQSRPTAEGAHRRRQSAPRPLIRRLTPDSASLTQVPGLPPQPAQSTLTVSGSRFLPGAVVFWDGKPLPTTFVSASQLACQVTWAAQTVGTHSLPGTAHNVSNRQARVTVTDPGGRPSRPVNFHITIELLGG